MQKLYVAMVGLPARGKSTLARRIRDGLAAEGIRAALEGSSIRVDFVSDDSAVAAQADRIAVANEDAAAVESTAAAFADVLTDPSSQLLFLTSSRDTRYENYSVLRPLLDEQ